ncbi:MAG: hypothetical protein GF418_11995 [Chitinivibrionales bacterium]|nr:hypothetical protein [Chitinivibrionales bacterium]MBD3396339.1 hypothetical protein [Chitinivibrionales bacterium]
MSSPAVLVLTSYDPVTWDVSNPESAVVRAVIIDGNGSTVRGIDDSIEVFVLNRHYPRSSVEASTSAGSEYARLEAHADSLLVRSKGFTTFQEALTGMVFFVREPNGIAFDSCQLHSISVEAGIGEGAQYKYHPRGSVTVDIEPMLHPIVLSLSAYEPVEWQINNSGGPPQHISGGVYLLRAKLGSHVFSGRVCIVSQETSQWGRTP